MDHGDMDNNHGNMEIMDQGDMEMEIWRYRNGSWRYG